MVYGLNIFGLIHGSDWNEELLITFQCTNSFEWPAQDNQINQILLDPHLDILSLPSV